MNKNQLETFIDQNCTAISDFRASALEFQEAKNMRRQVGKRWNPARLNRETDLMVAAFVASVYDRLKPAVKIPTYQGWTDFIDQAGLLEELEDSVAEIEFE